MATKKTPTTKEKSKKTPAAEKTVKIDVVKPTVEAAIAPEKKGKKKGLETQVFDMSGKIAGSIALPEKIFAAKVNQVLMAQAIRVYLANQRKGSASTKTRGEVTGSTRKIYRQKGTGRARHGAVRAPIFVHGGIAHGPKPADYSLAMNRKMKRVALLSALSAKVKDSEVKVLQGLSGVAMKTKVVADTLRHMKVEGSILVIMPKHMENVLKASRNIKSVTVTSADRLNTYEVLGHKTVILMKETIEAMEKIFGKEKKHESE